MQKIFISSPTNPTIKELVRLKDRKGERAETSFLVEGCREIERALTMGFRLEDLFVCQQSLSSHSESLLQKVVGKRTVEVTKEAFAKVATREGSDGVIAVFADRCSTFNDILKRSGNRGPFVLAIENVEKPGNLGAILRTADGAGVDGVIMLGTTVDTWNPNVIRASLGGVFAVPVVSSRTEEFFDWCHQHKLETFAAVLSEKSRNLFGQRLRRPLAIILGSEATGLSEDIKTSASHHIMIPMHGVCDSLNVSVAAGILSYEAVRQDRGSPS